MNINKTKIMTNAGENINIKINRDKLEQVEEYISWTKNKLNGKNQETEIN